MRVVAIVMCKIKDEMLSILNAKFSSYHDSSKKETHCNCNRISAIILKSVKLVR